MLSINTELPERLEEAQALSRQLNMPFGDQGYIQLCACKDRWALKLSGANPMSVELDVAYWRNDKDLAKQEPLLRACKLKPQMRVVDLTAGFGRDAAILHACGASVTLIERDPIMQILLKDGLKRAQMQANPISLICDDASHYLMQLSPEHWPEIIYLDPMHPVRDKSAKVKKLMQSLQAWIMPDPDVGALLALARSRVLERVVVKWPARLPPLALPNHSIKGKTIRFDVYLPLVP